ncbi:hypothetical protein C8R45DRAFT_934815 [Mycena sanguinolenta]|nr:hypothetical protein C8R45DRAFT_934815 [Mycena sanguinolenta]
MTRWMLVSHDWLHIVLSIVFRDLWITSYAHFEYIVRICNDNTSFACDLAGIVSIHHHLIRTCRSLTISAYHKLQSDYTDVCTHLIEYATSDSHHDRLIPDRCRLHGYAIQTQRISTFIEYYTPGITSLHFVLIDCTAAYRAWDTDKLSSERTFGRIHYPDSLTELHITFAYTSPPSALLRDAPRGTFFPPPSRLDLPFECYFDGVQKLVVRDANADFVAFLTTACPQLQTIESTAEFSREDVPEKVPATVRDRLTFVRLPRTVNWGLTGSLDALPLPQPDPPEERPVSAAPAPLPQVTPPAPLEKRKNRLWRWRILERVKHVLRERKGTGQSRAESRNREGTFPIPDREAAAALASTQKGKVHVVGVLPASAFDWTANEDHRRLVEDFAAMRDLFTGAEDAVWLAGTDWESENLDFKQILDDSDPHTRPISVSAVPSTCLKTEFMLTLCRRVEQKAREDTVVVVLCGQVEEQNGDLIISRGPGPGEYQDALRREDVERFLEKVDVSNERVFLVLLSDPRASERWRSTSWTLVTASEAAQTCIEPGQMRGRGRAGVYSLIEPLSTIPIRPSTAEVLQRLQGFEPSAGLPRVEAPPLVIRPLSPEEKTLLLDLATAHNKVGYANVGRDTGVNGMARKVVHGEPLPERHERYLLECLCYRQRECRRADAIARHFGWTSTTSVEEWLHPNGLEQMKKAEVCGAAIASEFFLGPKVGARWWEEPDPQMVRKSGSSAFITLRKASPLLYTSMRPGAWLAHAWIQAGEPMVDPMRVSADWRETAVYSVHA